ncbi:uncharacterized protein BDV14DRAFT_9599 [Aspergillus stella-maris]|uniref:uncharacterized protein n=1 Tax=Aspergillus stella-maris TaxID=1810926 RepID=UPI003CCD0B81
MRVGCSKTTVTRHFRAEGFIYSNYEVCLADSLLRIIQDYYTCRELGLVVMVMANRQSISSTIPYSSCRNAFRMFVFLPSYYLNESRALFTHGSSSAQPLCDLNLTLLHQPASPCTTSLSSKIQHIRMLLKHLARYYWCLYQDSSKMDNTFSSPSLMELRSIQAPFERSIKAI